MSKNHNQGQIHVRNTSGKFRPGTTTPPAAAHEPTVLAPHEEAYLARGSKTDASTTDENIDPGGLDAVDVVEVITGTMHPDEGDSVDPSGQS
jgi:hypothetical protein